MIRNHKWTVCLIAACLLSSICADFVANSISDRLAIQIWDIQQLVVQEEKKAEDQTALGEAPESVIVTQTPDGHKNIAIYCSVNLNLNVGLSGETIRTYLQRLMDLTVLKDVCDLCEYYIKMVLGTEAILIMICATRMRYKSTTTCSSYNDMGKGVFSVF